MGIITQGKGLWNALFTRTQRQVLSLMFGHPERSYYANEVVRLAAVGTGSVQRELARLSEAGLLRVEKIGNQKHYRANPDSPIFEELRSIVIKTFGAVDLLRNAIGNWDADIEVAFLYGAGVAASRGGHPGIDLMVLSVDLEYAEAVSQLTAIENSIGRSINLMLLTPAEFRATLEEGNETLAGILRQPRIMLKGRLD